jgi:predicted small metal-binding protein
MASFMCKDLGMECSFEAKGTNDREIMRQFINHAESAHKMLVLPADVIYQIQKSIKK